MEENKKTICGCKCALDSVMEKINCFRKGNRLMVEKTGCVGVSFFKKDDPDRKFLKMSLEPDVKCSVVDVIVGAAGVFAVIAVIKTVTGIVRFIKWRLE